MNREQEKQRKYNYIVVFDCLVSDDVIERRYHGCTYDEVVEQAMKYSEQPYLSYGNFDIYHSEDEVYDLDQQFKKLLSEADNRNEFNENLYKQHFYSLKQSFIAKVRKELKLEIDGLEDIAERLEEKQRNKIQRRIDNIYKLLQKMEQQEVQHD